MQDFFSLFYYVLCGSVLYGLCRPYHTVLLLEDEQSLLSSLPIDASPSLIRLVKVANPLKNLQSLSLDADLAVEQVCLKWLVMWLPSYNL